MGQPSRNYFALSTGPRLRDFEDSGLCRESPGLEGKVSGARVNLRVTAAVCLMRESPTKSMKK